MKAFLLIRFLLRSLVLLVREIQRGNTYAISGTAIFGGIFAAIALIALVRRIGANRTHEPDESGEIFKKQEAFPEFDRD